jgi:hypothetical protein
MSYAVRVRVAAAVWRLGLGGVAAVPRQPLARCLYQHQF